MIWKIVIAITDNKLKNLYLLKIFIIFQTLSAQNVIPGWVLWARIEMKKQDQQTTLLLRNYTCHTRPWSGVLPGEPEQRATNRSTGFPYDLTQIGAENSLDYVEDCWLKPSFWLELHTLMCSGQAAMNSLARRKSSWSWVNCLHWLLLTATDINQTLPILNIHNSASGIYLLVKHDTHEMWKLICY